MKARSITIGILAVGIMISAATSTWSDVPKVDIPEITMPTPNAYDFYIKAVTQRKDNGEVENASYNTPSKIPTVPAPSVPVPAVFSPPAAPVAKPAVFVPTAATPVPVPRLVKRPGGDEIPSYTLDKKLILLANNAEALATFREGLKHTYLCPPADPTDKYDSKLRGFRSFSRLLVFESNVKLEQEKYGEALNVNLDTIQFGADIPRGGNITNCFEGTAIESMGRYPIWSYLDKLSEAEARGAALRLANIDDSEVPFSQTIAFEKWQMEAELVRTMKEGKLEQIVIGESGISDWRAFLALKASLASTSNQQIIDNYDGYMNKCITAAEFPYKNSQNVVNDGIALPNDPITRLILPNFFMARFKRTASVEVQNRLLMTALALHAYKLKYTEYPAQLSALAPEFLRKMPVDPFGNSALLKYRKDGDSYKLYSIGPDGKDDNGLEIFTKYGGSTNERRDYYVSPYSKGDIVAGINKN